MLHGGMQGYSGSRVGGVGADNPYADILSQSIVDARGILSILRPPVQPGINPATGYPYASNVNPATGMPYPTVNPATGMPYGVQAPGMFGSMDTTTMLVVGAIGIGAVLFFTMK